MGKLLTMHVLREHAPGWAQKAVEKLLKPSENASTRPPAFQNYNIIKYAWHRLYLVHVKDMEFQRLAVVKYKEREARAEREAAADAMLGLQSSTTTATTEDSNELNLEALLAVVAEHEKDMHVNEVPTEPKECAKSSADSKVVKSRNSNVASRQKAHL